MECIEHERLEQILIRKRKEGRTAAPMPGTEQFLRLHLAESQALENLKDHDAEHGCQRKKEQGSEFQGRSFGRGFKQSTSK